jgi:hypothetical protein
MSEEHEQERSVNKPLASEGDIAVFGKELPSGDEIYVISEGPKGNRTYTTLFPEISGYRLSPDEALALYQGYDIEAELTTKAGDDTYKASLALRGVKVESKRVGDKVYQNRTVDVGIALPRYKKDGEHFGYRIDGKDFFKTAGPSDRHVELFARDCFRLLNNETIEKQGVQLSLREIEDVTKDGKTYKTARIQSQVVDNRVGQEENAAVNV